MFFLLSGNDKKNRKKEEQPDLMTERVKDLFLGGKFPVVTTDKVEGKQISKVLGLVCCRGYDSEEAFFGMASRAVNKGAHAIVGYSENVAFHPDGSKYFSCFGTAVMFEWEAEQRFGAAALLNRFSMMDDGLPTSNERPLTNTFEREEDSVPQGYEAVQDKTVIAARDFLKSQASSILGAQAPEEEQKNLADMQGQSVSQALLRSNNAKNDEDDIDPAIFDARERRRRRNSLQRQIG